MQDASSSPSRLLPEPEPTRTGLSPTVAFLLLAALIAIVGIVIFLLRPDPVAPSGASDTTTEPSFALTNEQAIARFEELNDRLNQAFEQRDVSLLSSVYTANSPALQVAEREIRQLKKDRVFDRSTYETLKVRVVASSDSEVVLRERTLIHTRFESEAGKDVTSGPRQSIQLVEWTLRLQGTDWLIQDAVIKRSEVL